MKIAVEKLLLAALSIAIAYGLIYFLVRLLRAIEEPWAYKIAYWISPLSVTGWILAIVIAILAYITLRRLRP